jgi:methyl-accepting chemotaxis protein
MSLLHSLQLLNNGDFGACLPLDWDGKIENDQVALIVQEFNAITAKQRHYAEEMKRIRTSVGQGDLTTRIKTIENDAGGWVESSETLNEIIDTVTQPIKYMVDAIDSVRMGDLTQTIQPIKLHGEYCRAYESIADLLSMLRKFTDEVNKVSYNIGMGELGTTCVTDGINGMFVTEKLIVFRNLQGMFRKHEYNCIYPNRTTKSNCRSHYCSSRG